MARSDYRPDIDGLRAIAVTAVLLYHVGFETVRGGFVGVDVFFVISGFLITRLVVREIDAGTFTLRGFYARRIRRLGPALLFTISMVLLVGGVWLAPSHLRRLATSALHALVSTSNFHFWNGLSYFDAEIGLLPLLHTWSLAVEEQFYLVWPTLVLLASWRKHRGARVATLAAIFCISLWLAERGLDTDQPAVFFLMPFRVFELSLGGLVYALAERVSPKGPLAELLVLLGLAAIGLATFTYDANARFPGVAALLPCVGAAAVILGGEGHFVGAWLRAPPSVFVGRISYSLYLVHWPMILFYRFWVGEDLGPLAKAGVSVAAVACAALMYRFIEQPFRRPTRGAAPRAFSFAAGMVVVAGVNAAFACGVLLTDGWPQRFPPALRAALDPALEKASREFTWKAFEEHNRPFRGSHLFKVFAIGDSQAADMVNLVEHGPMRRAIDVVSFPTNKFCQMLFSPAFHAEDTMVARDCGATARRLLTDRRLAQADLVLLSFAWFPERLVGLPAEVRALRALGARKVVVVGRKDQGESSIDTLARWRAFAGVERQAAARPNRMAWDANAAIRQLASDFVFLDLMPVLCPARDACQVATADGVPVLFDRCHFTEAGAELVAAQWFARPETKALFGLPGEPPGHPLP